MPAHRLYVGTIGEGIFRSLDGGETFRRAADGMFVECHVRALVVHPSEPRTLYLGNEQGFFVSRDGYILTVYSHILETPDLRVHLRQEFIAFRNPQEGKNIGQCVFESTLQRQHPAGDLFTALACVIARFDLAWPDKRVAIEFESYEHHFGRQPWRRDKIRRNRATAHDWLVFFATEDQLGAGLDELCDEIELALSR